MKTSEELNPTLLQRLGEVKEQRKELQEEEKVLVEIAKDTWDEVKSKRSTKKEDGKTKVTQTYRPKGCDFEAVLTTYDKQTADYKAQCQKLMGAKKFKKWLKSQPTEKATQLDVNRKG